ncbi:hypothetical protein [Stutzerimonas sp. VN223-3]|uniref:hypothetical protein n=1 Tax=Stutzerimonas sp. VN223-3 TaxID=3384601 RepID=UPI0038B67FE1
MLDLLELRLLFGQRGFECLHYIQQALLATFEQRAHAALVNCHAGEELRGLVKLDAHPRKLPGELNDRILGLAAGVLDLPLPDWEQTLGETRKSWTVQAIQSVLNRIDALLLGLRSTCEQALDPVFFPLGHDCDQP